MKAGVLTLEKLNKAKNQLVEQVIKSGARLGLLLYFDRTGKRFRNPDTSSPLVLTLDVEDLAKELLTRPLAKTLVEHRNRSVHDIVD